jgi:hypothetical protein
MSVTPTIPNRCRAESLALLRALLNLTSRDLRPHCSDAGTGGLWLSDLEAERAEAVKLCVGCPVILECGAAATARGEYFGTWGDIDRTPPRQSHPKGVVPREEIDDDPSSADYATAAQRSVV